MTAAMTRYAMSRRTRNVIFAVCALIAMTLVTLDRTAVRPNRLRHQLTQPQQTVSDFEKYDGRKFTVAKVVDGDTLDIDIPDVSTSGGQAYSHTRIRLWGVDTPETKDPRTGPMYFGKEASEYASKLALGKQVTIYLEKEKNSRDKYHRLLAYVQLPDGIFLNEELLSEGYAYADLRFKHGLYNKYKQLEALARSQKKGLWAGVTPEQMPKWKQKRTNFTAENVEPLAESRLSEAETAEVNN
jgi:endonuclease YncB( thermonuclease family)